LCFVDLSRRADKLRSKWCLSASDNARALASNSTVMLHLIPKFTISPSESIFQLQVLHLVHNLATTGVCVTPHSTWIIRSCNKLSIWWNMGTQVKSFITELTEVRIFDSWLSISTCACWGGQPGWAFPTTPLLTFITEAFNSSWTSLPKWFIGECFCINTPLVPWLFQLTLRHVPLQKRWLFFLLHLANWKSNWIEQCNGFRALPWCAETPDWTD